MIALNLQRLFEAAESITCIFFIFGPVRFTLAQLASSHLFPLPGATSPPADVAMLPHRVTLHSHWTKTSPLPLFHLSIMLHPVALPLEPKLKHWICITTACHPSSDHPTPILHCYKKIISTVATLPTTQLHLHFASSVARAPRHRSFTHHHRSLSPLSHTMTLTLTNQSTLFHFPSNLSVCEFT
jgi:hypothetical protein